MDNNLIQEFNKREHKRKIKKIKILAVPFLIIAIIVVLILIINQPAPICFDEKKNGSEEQIDCGGDCVECGIKYAKPIKIISSSSISDGQVLAISDKLSEVVVKVQNVNVGYGVKFDYTISLFDQLGEEIKTISDQSYIFPVSAKYLIEPKLDYKSTDIAKVKVVFSNVEWFAFDKSADDIFSISDKKAVVLSATETGYLKVSGKISNKTSHDFDKANMQILLYSKTGQLLHATKTVISNVMANENAREFSYVGFPYFSGFSELDLNRVEIIVDALFE